SLYIIEDPTLQNMDAIMNTLKRNFGDLGLFIGEEDIFSVVNDNKLFAIGHKNGITFVTVPLNDIEDILNIYEGRMMYDARMSSISKAQIFIWQHIKVDNRRPRATYRSRATEKTGAHSGVSTARSDNRPRRDCCKRLSLTWIPPISTSVAEWPSAN